LKQVIFVDAQIKQLFEDHDYNTKLVATERKAWQEVGNVFRNFVENEK
jgi:hypothetical protein